MNTDKTTALIIHTDKVSRDDININGLSGDSIAYFKYNETHLSELEALLKKCNQDRLLIVNACQYAITFKNSALKLLNMVADTHKNWSFIYSDYEIVESNGNINEPKLLDYHKGRVRSDMDYGFAFLVHVDALKKVLPFSPETKQHIFWDLLLKLSQINKPVHIANRYSGSLYSVNKKQDEQNVFAYLMQSKSSQLEYEALLNHHLKAINAYLAPNQNISEVPYFEETFPLDASIIIPVNNRPEFIGTAIHSALNQTIKKVEVIVVVNGGEKDTTINEVKRYQEGGDLYDATKPNVKLIVHDINNIGLCINAGLEIAEGKYHVQLDSDDLLYEDAVEKLIAVYQSDETIGMVIGSYDVWELSKETKTISRLQSIPVVTHDEWTSENGRNNLLRINGAGAPRSFYIKLAKDLGYLDMNTSPRARNYGEDYDFVLRMSENYTIGRVWDPIYKVVRHDGGTDHNADMNTVDRNNNAKDGMRRAAINRRQKINGAHNG